MGAADPELYALGGKEKSWMPGAAEELFAQSMALGWDPRQGRLLLYVDRDDKPAKRSKLWWPMAKRRAPRPS